MKTVHVIILICLILTTIKAQSQAYNMNPDPNGTLWWTNDALSPDPQLLQNMQEFVPTTGSLALTLPVSVYNDTQPYFSHIVNQYGASCVQVAEIWYTFDYEINRKLGRTAGDGQSDFTNLYHPLYT
jgi:hypothetical protein